MTTSLMGRASIRGWELRQGIESLVSQVCRARGLTPPMIIWDAAIQTAAVDRAGGRMYLACPADDAVITRPVLVRYVGYVLHEVLHLVYTVPVKGTDGRYLPEYVHSLWNAIEDAWIEGRGIADRVAGNIEAVLRDLLAQMVREARAAVQDWADPRQYPFALAVYLRPHAAKVPLALGLEPIFAEAQRRLALSQSSADNVRIAEWVMAQLKALPKNQQQNQQQGQQQQGQQQAQEGGQKAQEGQGNGQGEGDPQEGEGEAQGEGEGEGEGEGQGEAQGQGQDGQGQDGEQVGDAQAPSEMSPATEVEPNLGEAGKISAGNGSTYCREASVLKDGQHLFPDYGPEYRAQVQAVPGRLRNELRRLFDNSGLSAFQRGRKSGALNVSALHKAGQSDRLFQRRQETEGVDSAVLILVDCSGSMSSRVNKFGRRDAAVSAALAIHEALTLAGCTVCIATFNDEVSTAIPWGCPTAKAKALMPTMQCGGGTNDLFAVRYGHEVLLRRPEQRKALMVLTDAGGQHDDVRVQIEAGERLGVSTIGIGIQAAIGKVYSKSVDVFDLADLGRAALSQMKLAA